MDWVIVSNSNKCRIFEHSKRPKNLELLKEIRFPSARLKRIDLTSDKPGHYSTTTTTRGTYAAHSDPKAVEIEKFALKIAKEIKNGRRKELYNELTVFAPAQMIGLINKHIPDSLQNFAKTIKKDYTHLSEVDILDILQPIEITKPRKRKKHSFSQAVINKGG